MFIASGVKADGKTVASDKVYMEVNGNLYEIDPKSLHVDKISDRLDNVDFLAAADATINGDRQNEYGKPERNFRVIANFWSNYLRGSGKEDLDITAERKKGKWITETINSYTKRTYCSICNEPAPFIYINDDEYNYSYGATELTNFCPNCGSDNRGEQD